jgi:hypothetical protein
MTRFLVVVGIALASVVFVPSALSDPPTIQRTPCDQTFNDNVDCGFPVQVHVVGTDLAIIFADREFDAFPQSRATLTNPATGTSFT